MNIEARERLYVTLQTLHMLGFRYKDERGPQTFAEAHLFERVGKAFDNHVLNPVAIAYELIRDGEPYIAEFSDNGYVAFKEV